MGRIFKLLMLQLTITPQHLSAPCRALVTPFVEIWFEVATVLHVRKRF